LLRRGLGRRRAAALGAWLIAVFIGAPDLPRPSPVPVADYVQYWAASRVNLAGGNPYDWHELLTAERQAEPSLTTPVLMWNPPWTLSLTTLPGLLPYQLSRTVWMTLCCLILAGSSVFLWNYWGGPTKGTIAAAMLVFAFPASFFATVMGQMSPLMLLGIVGFLYFEEKQRLGWAGAAVALTLVKPQVTYLLWAALLLWSLRSGRWRVLAGASAAVVAMCIVPLAANPWVVSQYVHAVLDHPPTYFVTPTVGALLRLVIGWDHTWPMLLPPLAGLAWWGWHCRGLDWTWRSQISLLLLVSVVTSPYVWLFDQVVLLPAVIQLAATHARGRSRATTTAAILCVSSIALAFATLTWDVIACEAGPMSAGLLRGVLTTANMFWHVAIAPVFLAGFLLFRRGESGT